jgi:hypothetical protein
MNARRWIAVALVTAFTTLGACTAGNPVGFAEGDGAIPLPEAPTDTSAFVPASNEMD